MKKTVLLLILMLLTSAAYADTSALVGEGELFAIEVVSVDKKVHGVGQLRTYPVRRTIEVMMYRNLQGEKPMSRDSVFVNHHELDITVWDINSKKIMVEALKSSKFKFAGHIKQGEVFLQNENGDIWRTVTEEGSMWKNKWLNNVMIDV